MTTTYSHPQKYIRPFDVRRDLLPVADLIEMCFADRLSREGEALVRKMRSSAGNKRFKRWAVRAAGRVSMPLSGFVWEDGQNVLGNLSFIPFRSFRRNYYLIANVAVHPDYQRQGIGRALVQRALQDLDTRQLDGIWLQVEDINQAAVDLYLQTDFQEIARRTTWILEPQKSQNAPPPLCQQEAMIQNRPPRHWEFQKRWLEKTYPKTLRWYFPFEFWSIRGNILGALAQFLLESPPTKQWTAIQATGEIAGILTWQASSGYADRLWLAAPPERAGLAIRTFFPALPKHERYRRPLRLNYPAGWAVTHLKQAGFTPVRTLIWMKWERGN